MKVINTFMHDGRVLRPGDAIPANVSDGEMLAWKNSGLIGENYDGPTRRSLPAPAETKPAAPARRQRTPQPAKPQDAPKPDETKAADIAQATPPAGDAGSNQQPAADAPADTAVANPAGLDAADAAANPAAGTGQDPAQQSLGGAESV